MTPQHPAAPEGETDASGLTEAEKSALCQALNADYEPRSGEPLYVAVERIVAERLRVVEGERDAVVAEAEIRGQMRHITAEMVRGDQPLDAKEEFIADLRARLSHVETERDEQIAKVLRLDGQYQELLELSQADVARAQSAEAAHAALVAEAKALGDEPVAPYPAECSCSHGVGFQFHAYPCRYSREVPRSAVRAILAGGGA